MLFCILGPRKMQKSIQIFEIHVFLHFSGSHNAINKYFLDLDACLHFLGPRRPSVYIVHVVPVWGLSVAMFTRTFNTPPPPPIVLCDVVCECTRQETGSVRAGYPPPLPPPLQLISCPTIRERGGLCNREAL